MTWRKRTIMEMARESGIRDCTCSGEFGCLEAFEKLVREEAVAEANEKANASWTLMCKKMVAIEREAIKQIIRETPFSNWFQADLIEAIDKRGQA